MVIAVYASQESCYNYNIVYIYIAMYYDCTIIICKFYYDIVLSVKIWI